MVTLQVVTLEGSFFRGGGATGWGGFCSGGGCFLGCVERRSLAISVAPSRTLAACEGSATKGAGRTRPRLLLRVASGTAGAAAAVGAPAVLSVAAGVPAGSAPWLKRVGMLAWGVPGGISVCDRLQTAAQHATTSDERASTHGALPAYCSGQSAPTKHLQIQIGAGSFHQGFLTVRMVAAVTVAVTVCCSVRRFSAGCIARSDRRWRLRLFLPGPEQPHHLRPRPAHLRSAVLHNGLGVVAYLGYCGQSCHVQACSRHVCFELFCASPAAVRINAIHTGCSRSKFGDTPCGMPLYHA